VVAASYYACECEGQMAGNLSSAPLAFARKEPLSEDVFDEIKDSQLVFSGIKFPLDKVLLASSKIASEVLQG